MTRDEIIEFVMCNSKGKTGLAAVGSIIDQLVSLISWQQEQIEELKFKLLVLESAGEEMKFEIVKLYFNDIYEGWSTKLVEEADKSNHYEEGYFVKVDGLYFMLGTNTNSYCVDGE